METRFYSRATHHFCCSLLRSYASCYTRGAHYFVWKNGPTIKYETIGRSRARHSSAQANPLGGFYESLLENPLPPPASDPQASKLQTERPPPEVRERFSEAQEEEIAAKARIVFGSSLAGPAERKQVKDRGGHVVAGMKVPPKPTEPNNCCMSGCVNCVWDVYRDDVEEWAAMKKKADRALVAQQRRMGGAALMAEGGDKTTGHTITSADGDGEGSEINRGNAEDEELFSGVPVGIREFMKQEKRLKEMRMKDGSTGG